MQVYLPLTKVMIADIGRGDVFSFNKQKLKSHIVILHEKCELSSFTVVKVRSLCIYGFREIK